MYQQLQATGLFEFMDLDVDEAEHSLEMQIPFLQHIMRCVLLSISIVGICPCVQQGAFLHARASDGGRP